MKNRQKGFTLIECIVSIALISIIIINASSVLSFAINSYKHYTETWQVEHNQQLALKYIEKRLKEFNQESIIFDSKNNIFQGTRHNGQIGYVDLSGKISYNKNTMIYFYKTRKEVRVNKNSEHNVLVSNIDDVIVNELIEGKLIEIEVVINKNKNPYKIRLNLNYGKK